MSKQFPECPLFNHKTCREAHNLKVCAIVRKDKVCLKKHQKSEETHVEFKGAAKQRGDKDLELTLNKTNRINIADCKMVALEYRPHHRPGGERSI